MQARGCGKSDKMEQFFTFVKGYGLVGDPRVPFTFNRSTFIFQPVAGIYFSEDPSKDFFT